MSGKGKGEKREEPVLDSTCDLMPYGSGCRIGTRLVERGFITEEQLAEALERADAESEPVGHALVDLGYLSWNDLYEELGHQADAVFRDVRGIELPRDIVRQLPADFVRRNQVLPLEVDDDGRLLVAMADPRNVLLVDDLKVVAAGPVVPVLADRGALAAAIAANYDGTAKASEALAEAVRAEKSGAPGVAEDFRDTSPAAELVDHLLSRAVSMRASDMHVEPAEDHVRVRFRIDGVLREEMRAPKESQARIVSRMKLMAGLDLAENRKPQDGQYSSTVNGEPYNFRVAVLPTVYGEHVDFRILRRNSVLLGLEEQGFLPETLAAFERSFRKPFGTILVTGPTGSGKSTTLYAVLNSLNTVERHIVTAEDPVEYRLPGITQVQMNPKAGLTFATALRSFLRSDPNVILVGEIRDDETANIAAEAALTGHLVLSTLHTNDAPTAIPRLQNMGVAPSLLAAVLDCVLAQRLARRLCPECRREVHANEFELVAAGYDPADLPETLWTSTGCRACGGTGYLGRIGLYELMPVTDELREAIAGSVGVDELRAIATAAGLVTLRQDGLTKARLGLTSLEEVLRVTL